MSDWIRIATPDGEIWSDQEHFLRRSDIRSLKLTKRVTVGSHGPDNGVTILLAPCTGYGTWSHTHWIRCKNFEASKALYERLIAEIEIA